MFVIRENWLGPEREAYHYYVRGTEISEDESHWSDDVTEARLFRTKEDAEAYQAGALPGLKSCDVLTVDEAIIIGKEGYSS